MNEIFSDDVFKTLGIALQQGISVWVLVDERGDIENLSKYQLTTIIGKNGQFNIGVLNPDYSVVAGDKTKMINKKIIVGYSFNKYDFQYVNGEYM